jgi:hypothetical protein
MGILKAIMCMHTPTWIVKVILFQHKLWCMLGSHLTSPTKDVIRSHG